MVYQKKQNFKEKVNNHIQKFIIFQCQHNILL